MQFFGKVQARKVLAEKKKIFQGFKTIWKGREYDPEILCVIL